MTTGPDGSFPPPAYDAILLAGGRARRLGGADKALLDLGGATLLDRGLAAVAGARRRIVVGPRRDLPAGVHSTREEPPGGGPVPAIEAGLRLVTQPWAVVLACDMPLVAAPSIEMLIGSAAQDGAILVDEGGRRQPLAAVYRSESLRAALAGIGASSGVSMRSLIDGLTLAEISADPGLTADCDSWDDLARLREQVRVGDARTGTPAMEE